MEGRSLFTCSLVADAATIVPGIDFDFGILPYPKDVTAASATGSWSYAITNNHHADKTAAVELLKFMTSAESSRAITDATGMIPARKDAVKDYAAGSPEYTLLKQLELSGKERPVTVAYPTFSTTFNQIIYRLNNTNLTDLLNSQARELQKEIDKVKDR